MRYCVVTSPHRDQCNTRLVRPPWLQKVADMVGVFSMYELV